MILILYKIVEFIVRLSLPLFFSDIVVLGRSFIPASGPVILIGNHPNMLLDGLVIGSTAGRPISVWAKSVLFKGLPGKILRALGAIPVRRRMDVSDTDNNNGKAAQRMDNSQLQAETFGALKSGRMLCLFPEGTSHSEAHILHLKDGISWMIFEFYDETNGDIEIPIQPCGITYLNKDKWRSQVVVQYAKPFVVTKERLAEYRADKKAAVKKLTAELEEVLYSVTVNSPDWESLKAIHAARRIYMEGTLLSLAEYVEVTRRFATVYEKLKDNPDVQQLKGDLLAYQKSLDQLHLKDYQVRLDISVKSTSWLVVDRMFFLLVLLPFALTGFLINAPIFIVGKLTNLLTPYQEAKATFKLMISMLLVPVIYLLYAVGLSFYFGIPFLGCLILIVGFGIAHVRILEEEVAVISSIVSSLRVISVIVTNSRRSELEKLRVTRADLSKRITKFVEDHATPDQRVLELGKMENLSATKRIVPPLLRRSSYSNIFL